MLGVYLLISGRGEPLLKPCLPCIAEAFLLVPSSSGSHLVAL
jgi:hypothetical protein